MCLTSYSIILTVLVSFRYANVDYVVIRSTQHNPEPEKIASYDIMSLGARRPGTSDYMLRTLRSLVKFKWLLISNNILGTF